MQGQIQSRNQFIKAISQRGVVIAGIILLGVSGAMTYGWMRMSSVKREVAAPVTTPVIQTVTALGRLEPRGEVIKLSAPTSSQGNRVDRLLVQEGDRVKVGQVIAILDSHDQRQAAQEEAEEQVKVARTQLEVIQAGAKKGEINAQKAEIERLIAERQGNIAAQAATVARLQSELQNAQAEFNRYQLLYQEGAISASERDSKRLALDKAQKSVQEAQVNLERLRSATPPELNSAKATLDKISEVRPVDVRSAQAEVNRAIAAYNQAKASFNQSLVRSPINGEVLDIHTRAGEVVATDGIAEIGQTRQMQAIAEVYQSDISKVQLGQRVRVTSTSIPGELTGKVERVDSQVRRQEVVNTDPSENIDARVIEVHINLDDASSQKAAKFTNLQVQVVIEQ
ncbi:MAG: ABC exporter membrane fusion protein [Desmonostoc vinosum HA7617-LM4]|jgi:HlyD family secretion protein|nr:ABC exporter membrane fusion protein [Desmonostoc vinosum HA7617-LM4]